MRASSSTTTMRSARALAGAFIGRHSRICNSGDCVQSLTGRKSTVLTLCYKSCGALQQSHDGSAHGAVMHACRRSQASVESIAILPARCPGLRQRSCWPRSRPAAAAAGRQPSGVLNLSASATVEVTKDLLTRRLQRPPAKAPTRRRCRAAAEAGARRRAGRGAQGRQAGPGRRADRQLLAATRATRRKARQRSPAGRARPNWWSRASDMRGDRPAQPAASDADHRAASASRCRARRARRSRPSHGAGHRALPRQGRPTGAAVRLRRLHDARGQRRHRASRGRRPRRR